MLILAVKMVTNILNGSMKNTKLYINSTHNLYFNIMKEL